MASCHPLTARISPCGHFFRRGDDSPLFLAADTAWLLFTRLSDDEIEHYLADRAAKGFAAVQACVFRDLHDPNTANIEGTRPFATEADLQAVQMNPDWIARVRRIVGRAAAHGLIVALLPTWGDKWNDHSNSVGPVIMNRARAQAYCRFLSDELGDCPNVMWVLGGDSPIQTTEHVAIMRAMAEGLRAGRSADKLITFYPTGLGSSEIFHSEPWLDFNALQTGHYKPNVAGYVFVERLFHTLPRKPVMDMEANYENAGMFAMCARTERHGFATGHLPWLPRFTAYDTRKSLWRTALAGAAGFSYGHDSVRQLFRPGDRVHAYQDADCLPWWEGLTAPGSGQVRLVADILLPRAPETRRPAQDLLKPVQLSGAWPDKLSVGLPFVGQRNEDPVARVSVMATDTAIIAHAPVRTMIDLDTTSLGARLSVSVFDPETGECQRHYETANKGELRITPDRDLDSVVVIDTI
ncbi:DUF4038 domain-containing protein [Oceaniglobus trochenteri]|uniref:apiosidase-like domain-containing protein n=1 Tax=Oceaniglobus trochenteri TaxID=2763260 RepID=UPI001CFFBE50|nr:DUF4038 domain-containing protein [Oceaniglobus trochenteri]